MHHLAALTFNLDSNSVSTTQCGFVMLETISHYNYNDNNVNVLLLDATKAFNRVHYCKLFKFLIDKVMSPLVI